MSCKAVGSAFSSETLKAKLELNAVRVSDILDRLTGASENITEKGTTNSKVFHLKYIFYPVFVYYGTIREHPPRKLAF